MLVLEREWSRHDSNENRDSGDAVKVGVVGESSTGRQQSPRHPRGPAKGITWGWGHRFYPPPSRDVHLPGTRPGPDGADRCHLHPEP